MVINPELLDKAKAAGAQFADAERQALLARTEYHSAVRRLHLAGASFREIAGTLSLSHQRVQQIVSSAGGTWWRRVWRTRTVGADAICTWCGRPPSEVSKLIAGPDVYICDVCIDSAERAAARRSRRGPFSQVSTKTVVGRCAFCRRRASAERSLVTAKAGHVCTDCLKMCREIADGAGA